MCVCVCVCGGVYYNNNVGGNANMGASIQNNTAQWWGLGVDIGLWTTISYYGGNGGDEVYIMYRGVSIAWHYVKQYKRWAEFVCIGCTVTF